MNEGKPLIAISSCLLGEAVRYNNGSTMDKWIIRELSKFVDFYPVCPEVAMGLGVPREEISLYYEDGSRKRGLISKYGRKDLTALAHQTYDKMNSEMAAHEINGFILMRRSPSCGLGNIKTTPKDDPNGVIKRYTGLYAENLERVYPGTPKVDSGRFRNSAYKENFIKAIFAHYRFHRLERKTSALQDFHKKYKYILMEHSQANLRKLGQIASSGKSKNIDDVFHDYKKLFFETLAIKATVKNRYNTFLHLTGYLKNVLETEDKHNLLDLLKEYKEGLSSYNVPLKLLHFLVNKYQIDYLQNHYYFCPYPKNLALLRDIE